MYLKLKRLIDIILSIIGIIVLSPVFLILIIGIKLDSKGPILFKQKRVGLHKTHFMILKFRTMRIDTPKDTPTHLLKDPDMYITKMGKFLRKTSLDELPQILNIIAGQMSIIRSEIKLESKVPILFKQKLVGLHKTHFMILKFRTMRIDTPKDTPTHLLKDPDMYITKMGKFLRKTSLDELPQILNIIAGQMSII